MRYFKFIYIAVSFVSVLSCNDDVNKSDHPIYINAQKLYSFRPSENAITKTLDLDATLYLAARSGDNLYIHSAPYARSPISPYPKLPLSLYVASLQTFSIKTSRQFSPTSGEAQAIAVDDKLYIYDTDYTKGGSFISKFNTESLEPGDSSFTHSGSTAQDLLAVDGKVFLNLGNEIRVFDATTFDKIKTIDISSPVFTSYRSKFVLDKDKNILIYNGGVRKLSPRDLSVKALRKHDVNTAIGIIRPGYNPEEEVLYIAIEIRREDGNIGHEIRKFNLVTFTEEKFLVNPGDISFDIYFISYSPENHLVIVGGGVGASGNVATFDTKGVLQKQYTLPSVAWAAY
jgi:hypothetical protein